MIFEVIKPKHVALLYAVFVAIYFPMLVSIPLTIDAEWYIALENYRFLISQGRWGSYLIASFISPPTVVPYFPIGFFGLMATIAYCFILRGCAVEFSFGSLLGFTVFACLPVWGFILEFTILAPSFGIALLTVAISILVLTGQVPQLGGRMAQIVAQVPLVAFATSVYQSFFFVYVVLALGAAVINERLKSDKERLELVTSALIVSILALLFYVAMHQLALTITGLKTAYIDVIPHVRRYKQFCWPLQ